MSRFVLDASVTLAWCFEDETSAYSDAVLNRVAEGEAVAPAIWTLEVANAVLQAELARRITMARAAQFLDRVAELPIQIDAECTVRSSTFKDIFTLGRQHRLAVYDAAYLELAVRERLSIATLDRALARAAGSIGVKVLH